MERGYKYNQIIMMILLICSTLIMIFLPSYSKDTIIDNNHDVINDIEYKNESYSSNHVLNKYIYSNFSRLLLVAGILLMFITIFFLLIITTIIILLGLEGTGHHAMSDMVNVCMGAPPSRSCSPDRDITMNLMHESGKKGGLFYAEGAGLTHQVIPAILSRMEFLARQKKSHLYFLGLEKVKGSGELSYPNFGGPNKELNHPDAYSIALLSELQGTIILILILILIIILKILMFITRLRF